MFPNEGHKVRDKGGKAWVQVMICSKCLDEVRKLLTKRIKAPGWVDRPQKAKRAAAKKMEQLSMFEPTETGSK